MASGFWEKKNNQQRLLLCIIGLIERRNHNKTAPFVEEKCIFLQDNAPAHKSIKTHSSYMGPLLDANSCNRHLPTSRSFDWFCSKIQAKSGRFKKEFEAYDVTLYP